MKSPKQKKTYSFSHLIETVTAVKDEKGNITVGTQVPVPAKPPQVQPAMSGTTGNPTNVSGVPQQGQQVNEWRHPIANREEYLPMNNESADVMDWDTIQFISNNYGNMYNLAARVFMMQLQHSLLARDIVDKISFLIPVQNYNTEANIATLQEFLVKNANTVFKAYEDGRYFVVLANIRTTWEKWNIQLNLELMYTIAGQLVDMKVTNKVIKHPKFEVIDTQKTDYIG